MHKVTAKRFGDSVEFFVEEYPEGDTKDALQKAKAKANSVFGYVEGMGVPTVSIKPVGIDDK